MLLIEYNNLIYLDLRVHDVCQEATDVNIFLELLYVEFFFPGE